MNTNMVRANKGRDAKSCVSTGDKIFYFFDSASCYLYANTSPSSSLAVNV